MEGCFCCMLRYKFKKRLSKCFMKQISNSKNLNFVLKPFNFVSELKKAKNKETDSTNNCRNERHFVLKGHFLKYFQSSVKMMKINFYFTLKALFVVKILKLLS